MKWINSDPFWPSSLTLIRPPTLFPTLAPSVILSTTTTLPHIMPSNGGLLLMGTQYSGAWLQGKALRAQITPREPLIGQRVFFDIPVPSLILHRFTPPKHYQIIFFLLYFFFYIFSPSSRNCFTSCKSFLVHKCGI